MFHPSFPSYADPNLFPAVCSSAAAAHQPFYDAGGSHPLFFSSPSPPYSSSLPHYLHRSNSAHSLSLPHGIPDQPPFLSSPHRHRHLQLPPSSSPSSNSGDYFDFNATPIRRVFSTGDLQGMNVMQPAGGYYSQEVSEIPPRIRPYTAEERKEKIERYRSKRSKRNFHKKITYACRKTLADSRPRVRGRFARNGETEIETEPEIKIEVAENCYDSHSSYNIYEQPPSNGCSNEDWWWQMMAALPTDEEEEWCHNEDIWANLDVFPMNLPS